MKKGLMLLLLAVCFASLSFGLVRIKPEHTVSKNTKIANLVNYVVKYNGIENPDLIHEGEAFYFSNQKGNTFGEPSLLIEVYKGDCLWTMSRNFIYGDPRFPYVLQKSLPIVKPVPASAPVIPETENSGLDWTGFLVGVVVGLLLLACYLAFKNEQLKDENKKTSEANELEKKILERELEVTKNRLPIVAPVLSNEKWLRENFPIEVPRRYDNLGNLTPTASTIARVFGKTPDLIAYALVSTKESAVNMEFSNERHANTGLSGVAVWLGWNWNIEESKWVEVGMIASICSNGFVMNPEKVKKMDSLFTSVELVNKSQHPVLSEEKVPGGTLYPELVAGLVIKYRESAIEDLRKAGATVTLPTKEEKK